MVRTKDCVRSESSAQMCMVTAVAQRQSKYLVHCMQVRSLASLVQKDGQKKDFCLRATAQRSWPGIVKCSRKQLHMLVFTIYLLLNTKSSAP